MGRVREGRGYGSIPGVSSYIVAVERFCALSALGAKLRLGTSVILLPLRNPVQLAKAYSTLDVMSSGRSVMGVGLGGGHLSSREDVFGYTREGRVTRFTEAVQIMKLLWTEPKASFSGRYWEFDDILCWRERNCRAL